jgi:hypothetical protein
MKKSRAFSSLGLLVFFGFGCWASGMMYAPVLALFVAAFYMESMSLLFSWRGSEAKGSEHCNNVKEAD